MHDEVYIKRQIKQGFLNQAMTALAELEQELWPVLRESAPKHTGTATFFPVHMTNLRRLINELATCDNDAEATR